MKMHGPDKDVALLIAREDAGVRVGITLSEVYDIIHDRLEYARVRGQDSGSSVPLSYTTDIDALTQQCMVEIRKKLGLYSDVEPAEGSLGPWTGGSHT